jgi:hypothetical protein
MRNTNELCLGCGTTVDRTGKNRKNAAYCTTECGRLSRNQRVGQVSGLPGICAGTVGAYSELLTTADLLSRGFDVFRAVSPACSCDLSIVRDHKMWRVEVTTGYRYKDKLSHGKKPSPKYDLLAVVVTLTGEITYFPPIETLGSHADASETSETPNGATSEPEAATQQDWRDALIRDAAEFIVRFREQEPDAANWMFHYETQCK